MKSWGPAIAQLVYAELWDLVTAKKRETFVGKPVGYTGVGK